MGQQQLLLLVMGVVIVGIAVMAGFYAFESKSKQFAVDRLVDRNLTIASSAVGWKMRSDPYNGGNASYVGFSLESVALKEEAAGGQFITLDKNAETLIITAVSKKYPQIGVETRVVGDEIVSTEVAHDGSIALEAEPE